MQLSSETSNTGSSFFELQSVDSTNNYALARLHEGLACHGDCFFAYEQTRGKGQRGKIWISEPSSNIALSLVLQPNFLNTFEQFQLSASIAVAVAEFFKKYAGDETRIKWPNDIYWRDRKAGGILIESIVESRESRVGNWQWAVTGIGMNINQTKFPAELQNPVSLKQITGKDHHVIDLAKELWNQVMIGYEDLKNGGFKNILEQYNDLLYKKNEIVKLKKDNRIFKTKIKSVDQQGQLLTQNSIEENFDFGQIEWLL